MQTTLRKWLHIVGAMILVVALAACGGGAAESGEGDGEGVSAMASPGGDAAETGDAAPTESEEGESHALREGGSEFAGSEGEGEHGGPEGEGEHGGSEGRGEHSGEGSEGRGEHGEGSEGGEHDGEEGSHDEEGEESGVYIARAATWDAVRRGARLVLGFDEASGAFVGTVENTTEGRLCAIRVEVHLDTPMELGPTARTDLGVGETVDVRLPADGHAFDSWTAHPEQSGCGGR